MNLDDLPDRPLSPLSLKHYAARLRQIDGVAGRPLDDVQLAEALLALGSSRSPSWSGQAVAAARSRDPDIIGPATAKVMRHLRRTRSSPPRHAVPIGWADVDRIVADCEALDTVWGDRNAALISLMSDALLRASEASALNAGDVAPAPGSDSGTVTVNRSKTDQLALGATLWVSWETLQLVKRLNRPDGEPLFVNQRGDRLSPASVARAIRRCAAKWAGIEGASGHSLRVGSAIELVRRGASIVECQQAGRWASPRMPAHYARGEIAAQTAVARLRRTTAPVPRTGTDAASLVA